MITDQDYSRSVLPFTEESYFSDRFDREIFKSIKKCKKKYGKVPSFDEVEVDISATLAESLAESIIERLREMRSTPADVALNMAVDMTEQRFRDVAIQNAIVECAEAIEENKITEFGSFPERLRKALGVTFDRSVGLSLTDESDMFRRYKMYVERPEKIKLGTDLMNYITDGGFEKGTLNIYIAPSNVGKTWKLIDDASFFFRSGYNVLYATFEMSEAKIMQRIESNLIGISTSEFKEISVESYMDSIKGINPVNGKLGRLFVKQFPTAGASIDNLAGVMDELETKQDFKADVVIVDYLMIMKPSDGRYANSYEKNQIISEDLRRLATERNICVDTAVQTNRSGYNVSDFNATSIGESMAILHICDCMIGLIRDSDLDEIGEMFIKILKNRYSTVVNQKFRIGSDVITQRFFDVKDSGIPDQVINTSATDRLKVDGRSLIRSKKKTFSEFKFDGE